MVALRFCVEVAGVAIFGIPIGDPRGRVFVSLPLSGWRSLLSQFVTRSPAVPLAHCAATTIAWIAEQWL